MRYVTADQVLRIHERILGPDQPVEYGLLESAIARPQQSAFGSDAYPDIHSKGAALFHSLCRNHAFVDGNKRTALVAVGAFYMLNGYLFTAPDNELYHFTIDTAAGLHDVPTIAQTFKDWIRELPDE